MDDDLVLWGLLPLGVGVVLAAVSVYSLCRDFRTVQVLLSLPVLPVLAGAVWVLAESLRRGGWPTFIPHVALLFALPVVVAQVLLLPPRKHL